MAIESARVHLRNLSLLGAGAALLAVIGYFLMKSDRKKPRRRSSKSTNQDEITQLQIETNSNLITLGNELEVKTTTVMKINNDNEEVVHDHTLEEDLYEEDKLHDNKVEQTQSITEMDKLSDASSDSGNGQSDIQQMYNSMINEYEELNKTEKTISSTNSNNSTDDESTSTSTSTSTSSISKSTNNTPEHSTPSSTATSQQENTETNLETLKQEQIDLNQIKIKSKSSSSSSSSSSSTSSFQATIAKTATTTSITTTTTPPLTNIKPKPKITKNSKINFESKKFKNVKKNELQQQDVTNKESQRLPVEDNKTRKDSTSSSTSTTKSSSGEDLVVYEFNFPRKFCGKLIGKNGIHVDYIRSKTHTQIAVRNDPHVEDLQVVCVSGRIDDVDAALDIISMRFPANLYPQISFKPISKPIVYRRFNPEKKSLFEQSKILVASNMFVQISDVVKTTTNNKPLPPPNQSTNQSLNELNRNQPNKPIEFNVKFPVHVTAIVNATHVFIQLPSHTSYDNLPKLDETMIKAYSDLSEPVPNMIEPIEYGTICAAPTSYGWHRAVVTNYQSYDDATQSMLSLSSLNISDDLSSLSSSGIATVKFLDYGGYLNIPANQLKQLRSDFMLLPFQAIECYLDGIFPYEGTEENGKAFLSHIIKSSTFEAAVTGYSDDNTPLVKLYISNELAKGICLNNELEKFGLVYSAFGGINDIHSENNSLDHYLDSYTSLPYSSINDQFSI